MVAGLAPEQGQAQWTVGGQGGVLGAGRSLLNEVDHPHADLLAVGEAQPDRRAVGQLARHGSVSPGEQPTQAPDLLIDAGQVLTALQRIGRVAPVTDALRIFGALGAEPVASAAQFGQFRFDSGAFPVREVRCSAVRSHARQRTAVPD